MGGGSALILLMVFKISIAPDHFMGPGNPKCPLTLVCLLVSVFLNLNLHFLSLEPLGNFEVIIERRKLNLHFKLTAAVLLVMLQHALGGRRSRAKRDTLLFLLDLGKASFEQHPCSISTPFPHVLDPSLRESSPTAVGGRTIPPKPSLC